MGKQHLCFSVTGIFTEQEADVVGIIGSSYWLGLECLCLVFWIVREESGGWKKEGRELDCPSPAQTITDKLEGQVSQNVGYLIFKPQKSLAKLDGWSP